MKVTKTASGRTVVKMSRSQWEAIGKQAGWMEDQLAGLTTVEEVDERLKNLQDRYRAIVNLYPHDSIDSHHQCRDEEDVDHLVEKISLARRMRALRKRRKELQEGRGIQRQQGAKGKRSGWVRTTRTADTTPTTTRRSASPETA